MKEAFLKSFPKDTSIIIEGSVSQEVYLIKSGRVDIVKNSPSGTVKLASLGPKELFGEMALIEERPRSASAIAVLDTECYVINAQIFEQKLNELDPFLRAIFRVMGNTIRRLSKEKIIAELAP
ncbi:MAG: cyclic nucleotide-binding domain-containing protein [Alphaproteobacteria bacterium]|nr:cyclic nucleotide-binding domain-containing protein [Alphaproteobacteria bacterium]